MADFNRYYQISLLIAKKAAESLTIEEEKQLDTWRKTSPENETLYRSVFYKKEQDERNRYVDRINTGYAWNKVSKHITSAKILRRNRKIYNLCRVAAIGILAIGLSCLLFQEITSDQGMPIAAEITTGGYKALLITEEGKEIKLQDTTVKRISTSKGLTINNNGKMVNYQPGDSVSNTYIQSVYHRLVIPEGGEYQITLADGSVVWLNSGSELKYPVVFTGRAREIYLTGEAYFSVQKNAAHPFIVNLENNIKVEVLGTEFNICAYPNDPFVQTTLNKGAVKMTTSGQSVRLTPNQQATCNLTTGEMRLRTVVAADYSAWKDGKFIFEDERLESIMTRISRWYNVKIFYQSPGIKDFHFTGDLEKYEDFKTIFSMIEKSTNVTFEINRNTITVKEVKKIY